MNTVIPGFWYLNQKKIEKKFLEKKYKLYSFDAHNIKYNLKNLELKSITQLDKFGGKTQINVLNLSNAENDDLIFDSIRFKDFEIIDLR